jgi:hypothetical protein
MCNLSLNRIFNFPFGFLACTSTIVSYGSNIVSNNSKIILLVQSRPWSRGD